MQKRNYVSRNNCDSLKKINKEKTEKVTLKAETENS